MILICCFLYSLQAGTDGDVIAAGTVITNVAQATYEDQNGANFQTVSQVIKVTIAAVPAITVTPDEDTPSAVVSPYDTVTRYFRICNSGNIEDVFNITRAEITSPATISNIYFDSDNSLSVTQGDNPVIVNQTLTPRLAPGSCIGVIFAIETNNVTPQSQITATLVSRSTLPIASSRDYAEDSGVIVNSVGNGVSFGAPGDKSLPPTKSVENQGRVIAAPAQVLNYKISFRNYGSIAARQVRVLDNLPAELEYISGTLQLNNRALTDGQDTDEGMVSSRNVELLIPEIAPDAVTEIKFQARLTGAGIGGTGIINTAQIAGKNAPSIASCETVAVINPIGTIYAGNSLGAVRVAGAKVTIAADENGNPVSLIPNIGFAPNTDNVNEYTTDGNGNFSFALDENQIGTAAKPTRYVFAVRAPGFRSRMLELFVSRSNLAAGLFNASVRALDDQPISSAGNFSLTTENVRLENLAALVFNVPMFELSTLEISKTADKQTAEIGEIVSYRVQVKNSAAYGFQNVVVKDTLPQSFAYVSKTAQLENGLNNQPLEPTINGNQLAFNIGEVEAGKNFSITYRVRIGASAPEGEQYNLAVVGGTLPSGQTMTTQPAKALVRVRGGVFSMRQILVGRVYEDLNLNGKFDQGERPVAGARVYLNNGQSIVTDSAGQYNLPTLGEGSFVVSLDPVTVPQNYFLSNDDDRRSSKSWTRLLQTPLGGGTLLRQNFAVAPNSPQDIFISSQQIIDVSAAAKQAVGAKQPVQIASLGNGNPIGLPPSNPSETKKATATDKTETFTEVTTENIEAVAAGDILILSPKMQDVIMAPALSVTTRVAKDWTVAAEINGEKISSQNIGESRIDNRNKLATYSFVGLNIRPGENKIRMTAIGPDGAAGKTEEVKVWGRGAVERMEIVPARNQVQAGGRETVAVEIRGFDHWGNPAADGQVAVETSAGYFIVKQNPTNAAETPELPRQQMLSLEKGVAIVQFAGSGTSETAHLKAVVGKIEVRSDIRINPELRPQILVGMGELSFGRNAPGITTSGKDSNFQSRFSLYYRGQLLGSNNLLTLAYDSQRALNRVTGRDRFGGFDPLDRSYPIFGDSSQRFEDAQSNSKVYARLDRNNSYAMFGDMETDQENLSLAGYSRRLTGVKLHLENATGNFVSVTGARPDTAFARDTFAGGGLSLVQLSHIDLLQGSEVVAIEVRDRRNPEVILKCETLVRSVDYNIDSQRGEIFFLRPISTFDYLLNLVQIVITYEYRGTGSANYVYTGRGVQSFKNLGLRIGASYVNQQQNEIGAFQLGGIDAEKTLWRGGKLNFEAAISDGRFAAGVNAFNDDNSEAAGDRNGTAFRARLEQPLPFFKSRLRTDFSRSSRRFYNPFGATMAPGAQRLQIDLEMNPAARRAFVVGYTDERNDTENVSNLRRTVSFLWSEQWNSQIRTMLGFDRRHLNDNLTEKTTDSNLITAGVEYRPTDKIEITAKREQNIGEADPTYPNQTTFAVNYSLNSNAKLFLTQRLASAPITPIGDFSNGGFSATGSRNETAIGIETKISRLGALNGRYQLENGANGTDSFAVIGLQNSWSLTKTIALEGGFERGFLLKGDDTSFNSVTAGGSWTPLEGFRAAARYEIRDRNGLGQLFTIGAAGKIGDNWTSLIRGQRALTNFNDRHGESTNITAAAAYRPLESDKYALLFSYNRRDTTQEGSISNGIRQAALRDRSDTLSTDGLYQVNRDLEVYGRFALRFNANGDQQTIYASALTYLGQVRAQQRLGNYFDVAGEARWLAQPGSSTFRRSAGAELGYWATPDIRFGLGYNFARSGLAGSPLLDGNRQFRGGFYFTITTKLANLFDLFGTSRQGLQTSNEQTGTTDNSKPNN